MRNAQKCSCSFSQSDADFAGERIQVNNTNSCGCHNHCHCQDSCRPRPCPPRPCRPKPCPPRPCPPKPCPPRPCPSCEDRCAAQYHNCMRNCRWENSPYDCHCHHHEPHYPYNEYGFGSSYGAYGNERGYEEEHFDDFNQFDPNSES